jgi:hypothetical protein
MNEASERVHATFGVACTRAMHTLEQVQEHAGRYPLHETATVLPV